MFTRPGIPRTKTCKVNAMSQCFLAIVSKHMQLGTQDIDF